MFCNNSSLAIIEQHHSETSGSVLHHVLTVWLQYDIRALTRQTQIRHSGIKDTLPDFVPQELVLTCLLY